FAPPPVVVPPSPPPTVEKPIQEIKPIQPTKTDAENEIWNEAQKRNTVDDYQVYIDSYPKGKYTGFAKASIKKLKLEQAPKVEPAAPTPQKVQATVSIKTTNSKDLFYDKFTG
ncbi:hypothetical protein MEO41_28715, partial [Dolichospermum sp. ST_sed4]|nr:hypothetical protein [Dolichospermum sp. ST_sed4]